MSISKLPLADRLENLACDECLLDGEQRDVNDAAALLRQTVGALEEAKTELGLYHLQEFGEDYNNPKLNDILSAAYGEKSDG